MELRRGNYQQVLGGRTATRSYARLGTIASTLGILAGGAGVAAGGGITSAIGAGLSTAGLFAFASGNLPIGIALTLFGLFASLIQPIVASASANRGDATITLNPSADPSSAQVRARIQETSRGYDPLTSGTPIFSGRA